MQSQQTLRVSAIIDPKHRFPKIGMNWKIEPNYPAEVKERLQTVEGTATRNLDAINERMGPEKQQELVRRMYALVKSRDPVWVRLRAINALADESATYYTENIPCKRGCSHCCYLKVELTRPEAEMLGSAIKRQPKKVPKTTAERPFQFGYDKPCTFLRDGECSIYPHRPLACRIYFSLDNDSLLCRLIQPRTPPVPGINTAEFFEAYSAICENSPVADIREYFPPDKK